jgi:hypothetical protein
MKTVFAIFCFVVCLTGCSFFGATTVLSSRKSPDGSMVAENVLVDDPGGGAGYLIIRSTLTDDRYKALMGTPAADLFMRWIDNTHLEIWREGSRDISEPDDVGPVHVVRKSYVFPYNIDERNLNGDVSPREITVPEANVSTTFSQLSSEKLRSCKLSIGIAPDPAFDAASLEITVGVSTSCEHHRPCGAGMHTRFSLSNGHASDRQTILTAATIADQLPSNNRVAEGTGGTTVRGQFLEQNAIAVLEHLAQPSIQIVYWRDFFKQKIKYDVPLVGSTKALSESRACIGDADFLWGRHLSRS